MLLGNGLTTAAVSLAGGSPVSMNSSLTIDDGLTVQLEKEATHEARRIGRGSPNIEDRLRVALSLERALRTLEDDRADEVRRSIDGALTSLCADVLAAESAVRDPPLGMDSADHRFTAAGYIVAFILSFASRTPTRDRLHIFTTNYDRLIEDACDRAGIRLVDRFIGQLTPRFRSSRLDIDIHYSPPGIRGEPRFLEGVVRLTKMHGSIDWTTRRGEVIRRHIDFGDLSKATLAADSSTLIFPQSSKDVETDFYPYADLFRDFSAALCRPNSVVVTYGYGFGDDHINRILRDMLTLPSTHLVIISWDAAQGRISRFIEDTQSESQTSLLLGPHFGDLRTLVDHYLPKPAIDDITWRRASLLRNRAIPPTGRREEGDDDLDA